VPVAHSGALPPFTVLHSYPLPFAVTPFRQSVCGEQFAVISILSSIFLEISIHSTLKMKSQKVSNTNPPKKASSAKSDQAAPSSPLPIQPQTGKQSTKTRCLSSCEACGTKIAKDTRALQCDICSSDNAWKCLACMN